MNAEQQRKWGVVASAILNGEHDEDLAKIEQAVAHRQKKVLELSGIRKGAKVRVAVNKRSGPYSGREGVVTKINKVRCTVAMTCDECGSATVVPEATPWDARCKKCSGFPDEVGIPKDLLEVTA